MGTGLENKHPIVRQLAQGTCPHGVQAPALPGNGESLLLYAQSVLGKLGVHAQTHLPKCPHPRSQEATTALSRPWLQHRKPLQGAPFVVLTHVCQMAL